MQSAAERSSSTSALIVLMLGLEAAAQRGHLGRDQEPGRRRARSARSAFENDGHVDDFLHYSTPYGR